MLIKIICYNDFMKKICLVLWTLMFSFAFGAVEIKDSGLIQLGDYKKINCFSAKTKIPSKIITSLFSMTSVTELRVCKV